MFKQSNLHFKGINEQREWFDLFDKSDQFLFDVQVETLARESYQIAFDFWELACHKLDEDADYGIEERYCIKQSFLWDFGKKYAAALGASFETSLVNRAFFTAKRTPADAILSDASFLQNGFPPEEDFLNHLRDIYNFYQEELTGGRGAVMMASVMETTTETEDLEETAAEESAATPVFSWQTDVVQLPEQLCANKGKGIKIALLDSGVDFTFPSIKHLDIDGRKFDFQKNNPSGNDAVEDVRPWENPHGSHSASILCGVGAPVLGVVPDADLYIFRISKPNGKVNVQGVMRAFRLAEVLDIDILVCPIQMEATNSVSQSVMDAAIASLAAKKIQVIAPTNNTNMAKRFNKLKFPATHTASITIGAASDKLLADVQQNPPLHAAIDLIIKSKKVQVCSDVLPLPEVAFSSSHAVCFVAGMLALALAEKRQSDSKFRMNKDEALQFLTAFPELLNKEQFEALPILS